MMKDTRAETFSDRVQVNAWMREAGWQNSEIRQADLDKVCKVVDAALAEERKRWSGDFKLAIMPPAMQKELQGHVRRAVLAERARVEMQLKAVSDLAKTNSTRGDDCGVLARTVVDTLRAMNLSSEAEI